MKLTWDVPSDIEGLEQYIVYKDGKEFVRISSEATEVIVDELKINTIYGFKVSAKFINGEESKPVSINIRTKK